MASATRTVFATEVSSDANADDSWAAWSALEVGVTPTGNIVFYRARKGQLSDITAISHFDSVPHDDGNALHIVKSAQEGVAGDFSFDISVRHLNEPTAEFNGTFVANNVTRHWRGTFIAIKDTPTESIFKAPAEIDPQVRELLNLSPYKKIPGPNGTTGVVDEVQLMSGDIFRHIMLHSLSDRARNLLFPKLGDLGSGYPDVQVKPPGNLGFLSFESILNDNRKFFHLLGMHALCRDLSHTTWFDQEYRVATKDKLEDFLKQFKGEDTRDPAIVELRTQYSDSLNRCYYSAYIALRPQWAVFLQSPKDIFDKFSSHLLSEPFKEQWLPRLINPEEGQPTVQAQISMLDDKLHLLKSAAGGAAQALNVDSVTTALIQAAKQSGLLKEDLFLPHKHVAELKPQELFQDKEAKRDLNLLAALQYEETGFYEVADGSIIVNWFLRDEATPLGLYDY